MKEFVVKSDLYVYDLPDQTIFIDLQNPDKIEVIIRKEN